MHGVVAPVIALGFCAPKNVLFETPAKFIRGRGPFWAIGFIGNSAQAGGSMRLLIGHYS